MEGQLTTSDSDQANALRSIRDHRALPPQSPSTKALLTGHGHIHPPSPARFLNQNHPELTDPGPSVHTSSPSGSIANPLTLSGHSTGIDATPLPGSESNLASGSDLHAVGLHFREGSGNARKAKAAIRARDPEGSEEHLLSPYSYPPSQRVTFSERTNNLQHHDSYDHAPISAPTLFSHDAATLSLPQLDKYISSLPVPAFSSSSRTTAGTKNEKFVPLDRLAATGRSIKSLETNYKRKPIWRNCNSILGGLVNIVIGITVRKLHAAVPSLLDTS